MLLIKFDAIFFLQVTRDNPNKHHFLIKQEKN